MRRYLRFAILLIFLLSGCAVKAEFNTLDSADQPVFVPPTLAPTINPEINLPILQLESTPFTSTPAMECTDSLTFLEDLSIPDGSEITPNTILDKRWSVRNNGTCNWGEGYTIHLISGAEMGAPPEQPLIPARSGTDAIIRIQFTAPAEPGTYISAWQAFNPAGLPYGDQFFINIIVTGP